MVVIRFNQWNEFLEELKSDPPEDRVVRLSFSLRYNGKRVPHATMVAGYVSRDRVVEFVHYLGVQNMANDDRPREVAALFEERKRCLQDQRFEVRAGRYHVPVHRFVASVLHDGA